MGAPVGPDCLCGHSEWCRVCAPNSSQLWDLLEDLYYASRSRGVGFSLTFEGASETWHCEVISAAPSERWVGRNRKHRHEALSDCYDWIKGLPGAAHEGG